MHGRPSSPPPPCFVVQPGIKRLTTGVLLQQSPICDRRFDLEMACTQHGCKRTHSNEHMPRDVSRGKVTAPCCKRPSGKGGEGRSRATTTAPGVSTRQIHSPKGYDPWQGQGLGLLSDSPDNSPRGISRAMTTAPAVSEGQH